MKVWHMLLAVIITAFMVAHFKTILTFLALLGIVLVVLSFVVLLTAAIWLIDKVFFNG